MNFSTFDGSGGPGNGVSISILMATCAQDSPAWLEEAFDSLAAQTYQADELILIEDGPLPQAIDAVIARYVDRLRIARIRIPQPEGLGYALALGLQKCAGDLIARMDADDICEPRRLEAQVVDFLRDPDLAVLGTTAIAINETGSEGEVLQVPESADEIRHRIWACPFLHPSVMFRRAAILSVGGYDPQLKVRQDYDLWFRCVGAGLVMRNLREPLLKYRVAKRPKNRRLSIVWRQVLVGWRGCRLLRAPLATWLAVGAPLVLCFLPPPIPALLRQRFKF